MAKKSFRRIPKLLAALVVGASCSSVAALEMGFEGLLSYEFRQNTDDVNIDDGPIPDTKVANGILTVFGEQRSRVLSAGFSGELETERNLDDENDNVSTVTRFVGAADLAITPRTFHWYFGDVLASVRNEDTIRIADDLNENSTNVFVTGPTYESVIEGVSATEARLFYVHQSQDDEELESLYNFSVRHQRDTTVGSFYGIRFNDIYTAVAEDPDFDPTLGAAPDEDFNRMTLAIFSNRAREYSELYGELGATRYDTDNESITGLTAGLRYTKILGPRTTFNTGITHTLNDQTLNTIEALLINGGDDAGLQPEVDGIFAETRIDARYQVDLPRSEFELNVSLAQLGYKALTGDAANFLAVDGEDQNQGTVTAVYSKEFGPRWAGSLTGAFERAEYINRADTTDAVLITGVLGYTLTRSLNLEFSLIYDAGEGLRTRFTQAGDTVVSNEIEIDESETRASIGIRWAPPTRASRELTLQLNSLLQ